MLAVRAKCDMPGRLRNDFVELRADLTVVVDHCPAASSLGGRRVDTVRTDFKLRALLQGRHDLFFDLGSGRRLERAGGVSLPSPLDSAGDLLTLALLWWR